MNIAEFKNRLLLSKIKSEYFYLLIKKQQKQYSDMIFEIEVFETNKELSILKINDPGSTGSLSFNCQMFYNLRDDNNNQITFERYPELFTENPLDTTLFQKDLVKHNKQVFLKVDWGDGEITIINGKQTQISLSGKNYFCDRIFGSDITHLYSEPGIYKITVSGVCTSIFIHFSNINSYIPNENRGWKVTKMTSFGDLDNTILTNTYSAIILDKAQINCYLNFNKLKQVRTIYHLLTSPKNIYNLDITQIYNNAHIHSWEEIGGDNFFHHFPKLINARGAFYQSWITYVPNYCFSDNLYLRDISSCFNNCPIKYIGNYACANLTNLQIANNFAGFGDNIYITGETIEEIVNKYEEYIGEICHVGDNVFENCINLYNVSYWYQPYFNLKINDNNNDTLSIYICDKLGKSLFKNCYNLSADGVFSSDRWYFLEEIGEGLFENCYNIESVHLQWNSICLKSIGKNMFKGCKKINVLMGNMAYLSTSFEIPDNFLYDIEYRDNIQYTLNFHPFYDIIYTRGFSKGINNYSFSCFLAQMLPFGGFSGEPIEENAPLKVKIMTAFLNKFKPDTYNRLNIIKNNFPNNTYIKFGKNMFNEEFLQNVYFKTNKNYNLVLPNVFGLVIEISNYTSNYTEYEYYNIGCGEAAPYWKYIDLTDYTTTPNGSYAYGQESYTYNYNTIIPVHYDNISEIPYLLYENSTTNLVNGYTKIGYNIYKETR